MNKTSSCFTALLLCTLAGCKLLSAKKTQTSEDVRPWPSTTPSASTPAPQPSRCISNPSPRFTHPLIDPKFVQSVSPLPALAGSVAFEGRSYIAIDAQYEGVWIPVYAPTRMTLKAAKRYIPAGAPQGYHPDWALAFEVSCEISAGFAHIKEVSPRIQAVNKAPLDSNSGPVETLSPVEFEEGEIIGYYIKGGSSIAFDFIVENSWVRNQFANQERYESENNKLLHVVCPWELFDPELRQSYQALLANVGSIADPLRPMNCGRIEHDVIGTPSGAWFPDKDTATGAQNSDFSAFLAEDGWVYIGHKGFQMLRIAPQNPSFVDPTRITTEHCYEAIGGGYAYVRIVASDEMEVARSNTGACPPSFPEQEFLKMYR